MAALDVKMTQILDILNDSVITRGEGLAVLYVTF